MSKFKREFKNVVYNYTDAEAKVREATSNDPWGPSSAIMTELAEYTFHVQAYGLVMGMLWKRLNDHGKNWRHVYKSLVVLDYLIKNGSERVTVQCKENMFSIQTLKDFQYVDKEGKDQGSNIREKAKQLVSLLKDDDRLKDERKKAHQARSRATASGEATKSSSKNKNRVQFADGSKTKDGPDEASAASPTHRAEQDVEQARPNDQSEEDLQLKLALQLSKQQAEEEEKLKSQEDESLRAAIELSKQEAGDEQEQEPENNTDDLLLDFSQSGLADPWQQQPTEPPPSYDTLGDPFASTTQDPFATTTPAITSDPFASAALTATSDPFSSTITDPFASTAAPSDPFAPVSSSSGLFGGPGTSVGLASTGPVDWSSSVSPQNSIGAWSAGGPPPSSLAPAQSNAPPTSLGNPFDLSTLGADLPPLTTNPPKPQDRIEDQFLGSDFGNLVDLDSLAIPPPILNNPFGTNTTAPPTNPFDVNKPSAPSLNQMASVGFTSNDLLPPPLIPSDGNSPATGSPILPRTTPQPSFQANPFS